MVVLLTKHSSYLLTASVNAVSKYNLFLFTFQVPNPSCAVSGSRCKQILWSKRMELERGYPRVKEIIDQGGYLSGISDTSEKSTYIGRIPGANKDLFIVSLQHIRFFGWNLDALLDVRLK